MHSTTLINKTARELAREYFDGRLSFDDYRDKRRRLVDQVTGVDADVEEEAAVAQPAASPVPAVDEAAPACDVPGRASGQDTVCETRRFPLPVILLLIVGGLGAAGWLLFSGEGETPPEPPVSRAVQTPAPVAQAPVETDRAVQLVSDFIRADEWNNDALAAFVIAWSALDSADQENARTASGFRSLVEGLREQILEQRALGDMDNESGREAILMSFAEHLGAVHLLTDLRQTVPDTPGSDAASAPVVAARATADEIQPVDPAPAVDKPLPETVQRSEVDTAEPAPVAGQPDVPAVHEAQQPPPPPATQAPPPVAAPPVPAVMKPAATPAVEPVPVKSVPDKPVPAASVPVQPAAVTTSGEDPCPASLARTRRPVCRDILPDGEPGPPLVVLPAGSFKMGSTREDNEQPVHRVEIGRPFAISAYEVSRADYLRFCRASGTECPAGHWSGEQDPMANVSWNDARAYVEWLSQVTGAVYRLPSEAEWEYAARAGTTTEYPFSEGDKILPSDARFDADSPLAVNDRSVNANSFRLRHIMGNVREWVADVWQENYRGVPGDGSARLQPDNGKRVVRGGSYADTASRLRSAARSGLPADTRDRMTGFRVVREIHN
ncbi:MAG TPA: hypothetical protein ENJ80_00520 [Gammaproteobacteria bacterium]|nr:hypothetical protein [Gammaproteobacteria bacterium]